MVSVSLCLARCRATSAEEAISLLSRALFEEGRVHASFEAAALAREKRSPTGLPFESFAVALPHAEPEHTIAPSVAIATLTTPVRFREMGSEGDHVDVSIVLMPAFTAKEQAEASLTTWIELLQDDAFRARLLTEEDSKGLAALLTEALANR